MKSPNVLIVAESPISEQNGYGYALHCLFSTWKPEQLYQICPVTVYSSIQPSQDASAGLVWLHGINAGGKLDWLKYRVGVRAGWSGNYSRKWLKNALGNWRPDVVYCMANSTATIDYAYWASTSCHIPFVAHITDDIPVDYDPNCIKALTKAKSVLCSTTDHAYYLSEVLNRPCFFLPPIGCSYTYTKDSQSISKPDTSPFLFLYLGTVHSPDYYDTNYWSLKDVCHAVVSLAKDGFSCRLGIYGSAAEPSYARSLVVDDIVYYGGVPTKHEGHRLLTEADCLLIPLSFNSSALNAMKYCYSSKLPDSLASGTPTLVYAPLEAAIAKICLENQIGFLVSEQSQEAIKAMLKYLVLNPDASKIKARAHSAFARSHMSAESLSIRLKEFLCSDL